MGDVTDTTSIFYTVTTVQDAFMKLYNSVVEIKMKVELKDRCGPSTGAVGKKVGSGETVIGSPFYTLGAIWHIETSKCVL